MNRVTIIQCCLFRSFGRFRSDFRETVDRDATSTIAQRRTSYVCQQRTYYIPTRIKHAEIVKLQTLFCDWFFCVYSCYRSTFRGSRLEHHAGQIVRAVSCVRRQSLRIPLRRDVMWRMQGKKRYTHTHNNCYSFILYFTRCYSH